MKLIIALVILVLVGITVFVSLYANSQPKQTSVTSPTDALILTQNADKTMEYAGKNKDVKMKSSANEASLPSASIKHSPTEAELVTTAFQEAKKNLEIPIGIVPTIEYKEEIAIVTWLIPPSSNSSIPRTPGPDYYARVEINRNNGKIIRVLGGAE